MTSTAIVTMTKMMETLPEPAQEQALEYLQGRQRPGDRILVKGSRGVQLDRLADALRAAVAEESNEKQGG